MGATTKVSTELKLSNELAKVWQRVAKQFADKALQKSVFCGELTLKVKVEILAELMSYLRDKMGFDMLLDISGVDLLKETSRQKGEQRFEIVYELHNLTNAVNLRVKTSIAEDEEVPSLTEIWQAADWHEREAFDMFGVRFQNHPNLTRILMWEGYHYHPLRKDFPLEGIDSEVKDVAFSRAAPLDGSPFIAKSGQTAREREPGGR